MQTKQIQVKKQISREEIEGTKLIEYLTTPVINLTPEDHAKGYSHHFKSSGSELLEFGGMSPTTILAAVNQDLPESWKKQISEISFK